MISASGARQNEPVRSLGGEPSLLISPTPNGPVTHENIAPGGRVGHMLSCPSSTARGCVRVAVGTTLQVVMSTPLSISPGVGGVQGDETRRVTARWINGWSSYYVPTVGTSGAVYTEIIAGNQAEPAGGIVTTQPYVVRFDNDRVEPTGDRVRTRAYGSLACVYLGIPS